MTKQLSDILYPAEGFAQILRDLQSDRATVELRLEELQREETDILHEIERPRCLYNERARMATRLQKLRNERRALKDWQYSLKQTLVYMDSDKGIQLRNRLDELIGIVRKSIKDT